MLRPIPTRTDRRRAECPGHAYGAEDDIFEVRTDGCHYGTFVQEAARDVPMNATLRISIEHLGLFSQSPAEAHASLAVGTTTLVDLHIPIPSAAALHTIDVQVEAAFPAGTPIYFHLHNHGSNTWAFAEHRSASTPLRCAGHHEGQNRA